MPDVRIPGGVMTVAGSYKPGDQAPDGYLAWHDWAEAQHKAGLRQKECAKCGRWKYPQELSGQTAEYTGTTRGGQEVRMVGVVCNACADLPPNAELWGDAPTGAASHTNAGLGAAVLPAPTFDKGENK